MAGVTHEEGVFGNKTKTEGKQFPEGDVGSSPLCPRCKSKKVWRDAKRYTPNGFEIQRWSCRNCGVRFSDPNDTQRAKEAAKAVETVDTKSLKMAERIVTTCQICVTETKNLEAEQQKTEVLRRTDPAATNGKIVEYEFWLLKRGYAESTIEGRVKVMKRLVKLGADLFDPESIKEVRPCEKS